MKKTNDSGKILLLVSLHVLVVALLISLSLFDFDDYKSASDKITGATTTIAPDTFNSVVGLYLFLLVALVFLVLIMILLNNNKK